MPTFGMVLGRAIERLQPLANEESRLEAEVLLAVSAGIRRANLLAMLNDPCPPMAQQKVDEMLARRLRHEPLAYVVGSREFYGIDLMCSPAALIPRPETELIVELALAEIHGRAVPVSVADVGTGTGAIGIVIAKHTPSALIIATDTSRQALKLARKNAKCHAIENIAFVQCEFLPLASSFDIIAANLPYVSESEWQALPPAIREFEPRQALVGGRCGYETIERFLHGVCGRARKGALVLCEFGTNQAETLQRVASEIFPTGEVTIAKDLAGLERVLMIRT